MAKKIAILGAARSGLAVAKAAKAAGDEPTVYDSKALSALREAKATLDAEGIPLQAERTEPFTRDEAEELVTSPGVDSRSQVLQESQANGVKVIGEIEFAYRISQAPILAITGTNGKSTSTVMAWQCLRSMGLPAVLCGNIAGSGYDEMPLTEAAAKSRPEQVLVAEISSFQLEWIDTFEPNAAAITNIVPDHLNRYDSFEDYARTKLKVFQNLQEGDVGVFNHQDPITAAHVKSLQGPRMLAFGPGGDAWYDQESLQVLGASIRLSQLPFTGEHDLANACLAVLLVSGYMEAQGRSGAAQAALNALKDFKGLAHRMERVGFKNGILVINNSMCTNPDALLASSKSLQRKQHLVIGGVRKDLDFQNVGEHIREKGHRAYLFGRDANEIREQLHEDFIVFNTLEEAFEAAGASAREGEAIVLAPGCASLDQFEDFRARGEAFKRMAKEWLER